jgi:hypothetical protein
MAVSRLATSRNGWISGIHLPQGQRTYRAQTGCATLRLHAAVLGVQPHYRCMSSGWTVLWLTPFVLEVHLVGHGHQLLCVIFLHCQSNNTDCCITFAALMKHLCNHPYASQFDDRSKQSTGRQEVQDERIKIKVRRK